MLPIYISELLDHLRRVQLLQQGLLLLLLFHELLEAVETLLDVAQGLVALFFLLLGDVPLFLEVQHLLPDEQVERPLGSRVLGHSLHRALS